MIDTAKVLCLIAIISILSTIFRNLIEPEPQNPADHNDIHGSIELNQQMENNFGN